MIFLPSLKIGILNAWIFMIWPILSPFIFNFLIKEKKISKKLRTSVKMKFEKQFNIISTSGIIFGFIYSIFLPLKLDWIWLVIGIIIFLIGFIIDLSAIYTLKTAKPDEPFTKGPYRYSRHPIYLALLLIIISISIMTLSWIFLSIVVIAIIHALLAIPAEENYCLKKYCKAYQNYKEKTPKLIGFPKK